MEPTEEKMKIQLACRKFLNTPYGRNLDPAWFIDALLDARIIEDADAQFLRSEARLLHRQYYLFLQILPSKDHKSIAIAADIFRNSDQYAARALADALAPVSGWSAEIRAEGELEDEAGEELVVKVHVQKVAVTAGSLVDGSAGDEVVTPEGLEGSTDELPLDEESEVKPEQVQVKQVIGRGGYAMVHLGSYNGQQVAVKKFHDYDAFALAMFKSEIDVMKKLDHSNVIKYMGYVRIINDKQLWLLTEFIPGGSMRRFCTSGENSLPLRNKLEIKAKCWCGLAYLHSRNCCHKDLSPDNVLISEDLKCVKISDFGLAEFKVLMVTAATKPNGTTMYQPPEFAFESGAVRHPIKSDVYSMGASLCELFSEQWFWNLGAGRPRNQWQVMCKLLQQRQNLDAKSSPEPEPDCWNAVPDVVKPVLREAINPIYHQRKSAAELKQLTDELLQSVS